MKKKNFEEKKLEEKNFEEKKLEEKNILGVVFLAVHERPNIVS